MSEQANGMLYTLIPDMRIRWLRILKRLLKTESFRI